MRQIDRNKIKIIIIMLLLLLLLNYDLKKREIMHVNEETLVNGWCIVVVGWHCWGTQVSAATANPLSIYMSPASLPSFLCFFRYLFFFPIFLPFFYSKSHQNYHFFFQSQVSHNAALPRRLIPNHLFSFTIHISHHLFLFHFFM